MAARHGAILPFFYTKLKTLIIPDVRQAAFNGATCIDKDKLSVLYGGRELLSGQNLQQNLSPDFSDNRWWKKLGLPTFCLSGSQDGDWARFYWRLF